jgi:hypothetical protein
MAARALERISMPDDATFVHEYLYRRRPVIITDLFKNDDIARVRSLEDARRAFGSSTFKIGPEYTAAASKGKRSSEQAMTFDAYWNLVQRDRDTDLVCTEYEIPPRVMTAFTLPEVCRAKACDRDEILSLPLRCGDHDLLANVFMANRGNCAHLHYDGDHRHVLLYQVFGRKQVILFQPRSGIHLKPLDSLIGFSGVSLEKMSEEEKMRCVDEGDGYYGTLHPGETIYMPALIWHYLEYTDDAMSFNIRFGRNRYGRFLCVDNFHRDYYMQNFGAGLVDPSAAESIYKDGMERVVDEFLRPAPLLTKVKAMRSLLRELCDSICPEARTGEYCPPNHESVELERIMSDIGARMSYQSPDTVARLRPSGPVSTAQRRHLQENASRHGYSPAVLRRLLFNRVGKTEIESLTQAEAAQFMSYMRSPGAAW